MLENLEIELFSFDLIISISVHCSLYSICKKIDSESSRTLICFKLFELADNFFINKKLSAQRTNKKVYIQLDNLHATFSTHLDKVKAR